MWSAGADVDGKVGLGANLVEEVHEFVRSEGIRLDYAAPVGIECYRSLRTDAFAPVVFVCEAPAGPAHVRHFYRFERSDDIIANPARVRNFGVRADPDSFVNTVAEVLCKLAEEIAVNLRTGLGNVNKQCNFLCSRHRRSHSHSEQGQAGKK